MVFLRQDLAHLFRRIIGQDPSFVHENHPVRHGKNVIEPVLRHDDGGSDFTIYFFNRFQEIRSRNGIQLGSGLVQYQYIRLHGHYGRQVQSLLLATGQLGYVPHEPALYAEEIGHFRHSKADYLCIVTQAFQPEGKLMPYFIRNDLIVRILKNVTDAGGLLPVAYGLDGPPVKIHFSISFAVRREYGL